MTDEGRRRRKRATDREATGQTGEEVTEATDSDSDSARSLDLASSHSSDDDETSTRRSSHPPSANRKYIKVIKIQYVQNDPLFSESPIDHETSPNEMTIIKRR